MPNIWHCRSKDQCHDLKNIWKDTAAQSTQGWAGKVGSGTAPLLPHGTQGATQQQVSSTSPSRHCSILNKTLLWEENLVSEAVRRPSCHWGPSGWAGASRILPPHPEQPPVPALLAAAPGQAGSLAPLVSPLTPGMGAHNPRYRCR